MFKKPNKGNKTSFAVALILLLSLSGLMAFLPAVSAHTPPLTIPTFSFCNAAPNPVGVNQPVEVVFWLDKVPPTASTLYGDRWSFTVKITDPVGTTTTWGPYNTSDVGAGDFIYTPTTVGTYTLQAFFPTTVLAGANPSPVTGNTSPFVNDTYTASQSAIDTLVVQQQPIQSYPLNPLPTSFWNFPINGMNPTWGAIAGDWLLASYDAVGNRWNPYTQGPTSAHILWNYQISQGGIVGGSYADQNYYTGLAYETKFNSPLILEGNLYFNLPRGNNVGQGGTICINLKTGQTKWYEADAVTVGATITSANPTALGYPLGEQTVMNPVSFGQDLDYQSPNQYGIQSYLWTSGVSGTSTIPGVGNTTYNVYEPDTGQYLYSITNITNTGSNVLDANGNLLQYIWNAAGGWLAMWNSTRDIMHYMDPAVTPAGNLWEWRPQQTPFMDWKYGVQWNNTNEPILRDANNGLMAIDKIDFADGVIVTASGSIATPQWWQYEAGFSTLDGHNLWVQNRTTTPGQTTWALLCPAANGVYTEFRESEMSWYGYSVNTGNLVWGPTTPYTNAWGFYSWQASAAYGYLLALDFSGYVHAYNMSTGIQAWQYFTGSSGTTTAYGTWVLNNPPPTSAGPAGSGLIYVVGGHAYNPPLYPGDQIWCINATNGNLVWSELGFYTYDPVEVADGILVCYNCYDGTIYCYGQGPSATTVTAPQTAVPQGTPILLTGTVTDQSPGKTRIGVPAAGTPAISDASMSAWQAYLYMQQPKPNNATGVPVTLTCIDPNGNFQTIGTTTSDATGNYAIQWVPPVPGIYTVTATFAGSNSYYSSSGESSFLISTAPSAAVAATSAPTAAPTPTQAQTVAPTVVPTASIAATPSPVVVPPASGMPTATYIAIGAVVIIVLAAAAALIIRRRK